VGEYADRDQAAGETAPATPEAVQWQGWGTALKPAFEPIVVGRKPLTGTVAANVLRYGTGAFNVDGCRIGYTGRADMDQARVPQPNIARENYTVGGSNGRNGEMFDPSKGRWPANVALDDAAAAELDEQRGERGGGFGVRGQRTVGEGWAERPGDVNSWRGAGEVVGYGDMGGASRFYYTAKADQGERITHNGVAHPTVKPLDLMRWLAGSGTTVEAALLEGFRCIAIEREADYLPLITQRIHRRRDPIAYLTAAGDDLGLFGEGMT
jgi:site-specific DNA-methyltransferase (adenine-specific)